jgi:hypothetical protein
VLSEVLTFTKATLPKLAVKIKAGAAAVTLTIEAELTSDTAKIVGCHDTAFDGQDNPRNGFDKIEIPYTIDDCRVKLTSSRENGLSLMLNPHAVEKFKVLRVTDSLLGLTFCVTTDRARDAIDFMLDTIGAEFEVVVEPVQTELNFSGENSLADKPVVQDDDFLKQLGIGEEGAPDDPEPAEQGDN